MQETEAEVRFFRFCFWTLLLLAVSTILASAGYRYVYPRYNPYGHHGSIWEDLRFLMWWLGCGAIMSALIYRKLQSRKPLSEWFNRLVSVAKLVLVACISAAAILLCWWVWGEALQDWLLPVQVRSSDSQEKQPADRHDIFDQLSDQSKQQAKPERTAPVALDPSEVEEVKGTSTAPRGLTPDAFMREQKMKQQAKPGTTAPTPGDFDAFMQQQKTKASATVSPANNSTNQSRTTPRRQTRQTHR